MYQEYLNQLHEKISTLSSDDLKELLNNDEMIDEKVDQVLEVMKAEKNSLFEENREKATQNLEKEPTIIELKEKVAELMDQGRKTCESVQEKLTEIKDKGGNANQDTALALLQASAAESEEQTDDIYKKFTENEFNVEQFLEDFLTARKTMHLRKLKAEKMQELIRKQRTNPQGQRGSYNGGAGGYPTPTYGNIPASSGFYPKPPYPPPGAAPYPVNGPMMPMPMPSLPPRHF